MYHKVVSANLHTYMRTFHSYSTYNIKYHILKNTTITLEAAITNSWLHCPNARPNMHSLDVKPFRLSDEFQLSLRASVNKTNSQTV